MGLEYEDMLDDFNELKVDEKVIKKDAEEMFEFKMIDLGTSAIFKKNINLYVLCKLLLFGTVLGDLSTGYSNLSWSAGK